jgi:5-methylcytosine-specific restriction endonuclease McrA
MKAINAIIPRGLQIIFIMVILAVLVIFLAPRYDFLYPGIGIAAFLAVVAIFLIYRKGAEVADNKAGSEKKRKAKKSEEDVQATEASSEEVGVADNAEQTGEEEKVISESDNVAEPPSEQPAIPTYRTRFSRPGEKQSAFEVADKYYKMAATAKAEEEERNTWKPRPRVVETEIQETEEAEARVEGQDTEEKAVTDEAVELSPETEAEKEPESQAENEKGEPRSTLINDETVLTEEEKSQLENAVWYRCENPFCKHTHFLDVHHIIDEKDGGTNKLDNLIVLCPYCHELAHKNEIPEKEMRSWISNREERFKFKLNWRYF